MTREELIGIASKVTELRSEVAKLSAAQKELKRLEAILDELTGTPAIERKRGKVSIEDQVEGFLFGHADRDWSGDEVAVELKFQVPTTRAAFSKLRKAGKVVDTTRGRVQAKPAVEASANPKGIELVA